MCYSPKVLQSLFVTGLAIVFFNHASIDADQSPVPTSENFHLELTPGKYYQSSTQWLLFKIKIYPQVAVWVQTEDGQYLGTLYVTKKGGKNKWISAPDEGRPEALPVWNNLKKSDIDGVTSATSSTKISKNCSLDKPLPPGTYVVMLEVNRSYDYNATYTKENSGVDGQPSLIYQATLTIAAEDSSSATFKPEGVGSIDGSDGKIHAGLDGIDTALELFSQLRVTYHNKALP